MVRGCQQLLDSGQDTPSTDHRRQALQRLRARELIARFGAGRGRGTREGGDLGRLLLPSLGHALAWPAGAGAQGRKEGKRPGKGSPWGSGQSTALRQQGQGHTVRPGHTDTPGPTASDLGSQRHLDTKIHTCRYRHTWSRQTHNQRHRDGATQRRGHAPRGAADTPGHTATATWPQNQIKTTETRQDIHTARRTGTHRKSPTNKQVSRCTQLTDTHGQTSQTPTQHPMWTPNRTGAPTDTQRRRHPEGGPHADSDSRTDTDTLTKASAPTPLPGAKPR